MNLKIVDIIYLIIINLIGIYLVFFYSKSIRLYGTLLLTLGNISYLIYLRIKKRI